ncbi:DNA-processing protein DprA [Rothia nasimurium]|uniref:DNA-processing protein DprA n=1 Tax=Rothia nasimurium TaxID=85336 RepID=UPI003BA0D423
MTLLPPPDLEPIRRARAEILRITDPQDAVTAALIQLFGPLSTADYLTGRTTLTPTVLTAALESAQREDPRLRSYLLQGITERKERWQRRRGGITADQDLALAKACQAWLVVPEDPDWPAALNDLAEKTPVALWGRGDRRKLATLAYPQCVAVVGSRDMTAYGKAVTGQLAGDLARAGTTVISGGAFGIDATAHTAALALGTAPIPTLAFMAGGLDRLYPKSNEPLLRQVIDQGLVLSEVPLGQNPTRYRFLDRNRMIAAIAHSTVVVEARWRSGALNTAHYALEMGRTLYAVPGPIFSPSSEGCHRLIRDGLAQLITDAHHISQGRLDLSAPPEQSLFTPPQGEQALIDSLTEVQKRVWDTLPLRACATVEAVSADSSVPARTVMIALTQLSSLGLAENQGQGWRKAKPTQG